MPEMTAAAGAPPQMPQPTPARAPSPGPTSPAGVNVQNEGNAMRSKVLAGIAMTFLDQALALASSKTEEGQAILKMLNAGSKFFGPPPKELGMQELKLAQSRLNPMQQQPAGPAPQAAVQQRMGQLGMQRPPMQGAAA